MTSTQTKAEATATSGVGIKVEEEEKERGVRGEDWLGLLPKEETQALQFSRSVSSGAGVLVAVLDTGVDPGAAGLQRTCDGKVKVVDVVDCSGSGDVLMSAPLPCDADGNIVYLGKRFIVNTSWNCPSKTYRLGVKRASDLFPKDLTTRLREATKTQHELQFRAVESVLQKQLTEVINNNNNNNESKDNKDNNALLQEDIKTRIQCLRSLEKDLDDCGPLLLCCVFHDGARWWAAVDSTESGDLRQAVLLTDYFVSQQFATFGNEQHDANLNYCVNIYEEGSLLSIVCDATPHGTHVAGIIAAHHPEARECDGVAPGAQIVSLKIGDSRLGSMETATGLMRALSVAVSRGCNVINMSYGEATAWCNAGAFTKLTDEVVKKHNILFVASAGNNGPGISTVGCPGGTTSSCIGVSACVTSSLMTAAYSMLQQVPPINYNWSSCGPTLDGELGVSVMAPGAAITCVSTWTQNKKQLMNGTSMSSPNACGCVALLLGAAKDNGIEVSAASVRRALENSALLVPQVHVLGQGNGLVQVQAAWELLQRAHNNNNDPHRHMNYIIKSNHPHFSGGIYLREPHESSTANTFTMTVEPEFPSTATAEVKSGFEMRVRVQSSAAWITVPKQLLLLQSGKQIAVHVDPRSLPVGIHVEFVSLFDEATMHLQLGPIARFPVTVVRPEVVAPGTTQLSLGRVVFAAGQQVRRFIVPPRGCTFIDIRITDPRTPTRSDNNNNNNNNNGNNGGETGDAEIVESSEGTPDAVTADDGARNIVLHALQLFRGNAYSDHEQHTYKTLTPGCEHVVSWNVFEEVTMELVLGRTWGCLGDTACDAVVYFRGVQPVPAQIVISGGQRVSKQLRVFSPLTTTDVSPSGKLDKLTSVLKPQSARVSSLGERDRLINGAAVYQLLLEFELDLTEAYDVTIRFPGLQGVLYESNFCGQLFLVFNWRKLLVGGGDAFPKPIKLSKGKHTIRLQVRHQSSAVLESLTDLCAHVERPIKNPIVLQFFNSQTDAFAGNDNKSGSKVVHMGSSCSFFLREPSAESLPKSWSAGDVLSGAVTYLKKNSHSFGSTDRPTGYPVRYYLADTKTSQKPTATTTATTTTTTPVVTAEAALEAAVKEAKLKHLRGLVGGASFSVVFERLSVEFNNELGVAQSKLMHEEKLLAAKNAAYSKQQPDVLSNSALLLNNNTNTATTTAATADVSELQQLAGLVGGAEAVLVAAAAVAALVDRDAVARELGVNLDKEDPVAVARRKETESSKTALAEALSSQARAQLTLLLLLQRVNQINITATTTTTTATTTAAAAATEEEKEKVATTPPAAEENATVADASSSSLLLFAQSHTRESLRQSFLDSLKELARWDDIYNNNGPATASSNDRSGSLVIAKHLLCGNTGAALKKVSELLLVSEARLPVAARESLSRDRAACLLSLGLSLPANILGNWSLLAANDAFDPF